MTPASVGRTLQWARKRAGMTQRDVAEAVGMPQPSVARIERGSVLPRMATVLAILAATGHELLVEPGLAVRPEVRQAARETLSRPVPRRARAALGRDRGAMSLLRRLRAEAVPFVLVGDLAEVVRGAPRTVGGEVEICPAASDPAIELLAAVLRDMGASPLPDASDLRARRDIHLATDAGGLRLTSVTAAGDDYEVLIRNASRVIIDTSLLVPVAALEDLMRVRRARGETGDMEILAALESEHGWRDEPAPFRSPAAGSARRGEAG